jgi:hypothetical protein
VFRYFASKNDIVWGDFDRVLDRLHADLDSHGDDVPSGKLHIQSTRPWAQELLAAFQKLRTVTPATA